ncbi:MAG TPA: hypothetical protein PLN81_12225, partial [Bacillota bacterium]|nr:hypothetical protein [Bacillota bacterium]
FFYFMGKPILHNYTDSTGLRFKRALSSKNPQTQKRMVPSSSTSASAAQNGTCSIACFSNPL